MFIDILLDDIVFVGLNKKDVPDEINLDDLKNFKIIAREKGSGTFYTVLQKIHIPYENITITAGSLTAIKNLIKQDVGFSFVSLYSVKDEIQNNLFKIINIKGITPIKRNFYFVKKRNFNLSPSSQKFFEMMLKFLKN